MAPESSLDAFQGPPPSGDGNPLGMSVGEICARGVAQEYIPSRRIMDSANLALRAKPRCPNRPKMIQGRRVCLGGELRLSVLK